MKSGLEGRNNDIQDQPGRTFYLVSMKSGLEGRNNPGQSHRHPEQLWCLNEVRPRRPEQSLRRLVDLTRHD